MNKKEEFIKFIENYINENLANMNEDARIFLESLKIQENTEKPLFTDNGKLILEFMRNNDQTLTWTSKQLADRMEVSSKTIAGAMRKLVTDGFVEKLGQNPFTYTLTENGKNIEIV